MIVVSDNPRAINPTIHLVQLTQKKKKKITSLTGEQIKRFDIDYRLLIRMHVSHQKQD